MLTLTARSSGASLDKPLDIVRGPAARLAWAWDGLCFAVPFNETDVNGSRDIVNNQAPSVFTGVTWGRDNRGNTDAILGTGAYIEYPDHPRHDLPSTALTVYARVKRIGAGDGWGAVVSNVYDPAASPWTSWIITDDVSATGALTASVYFNGGSPGLGTIGNTATIGTAEYVSVFLRWAGQTGAGYNITLDVLGERGNSLSSIVGDGNEGPIGYAANRGIRINANEGSPPATMNGRYSQVLMWKRRLTAVEMTSLVADPFGWYSPRRESVALAGPYPVIAASGGRTSPFQRSLSIPSTQY